MFENLSIGHLLVALAIVVLLFGAKRIPEIAGSLGQGINVFKKSMSDGNVEASPSVVSRSTHDTANDDVHPEPKRLL